jgi:orotidine-5'-phosphate decarboxylase
MTKHQLFEQIKAKGSFLCVGLDSDIQKLPKHLIGTQNPVLEFNKRIIDATHKYTVAYKPNTAFYEAMGAKGWEILEKTLDFIPRECFTIADAKRGDIGNTSGLYARAFFDKNASGLDFDAVTVAPYMGEDSVRPFASYKDKWVILLALTSNTGAFDFQNLDVQDEGKLYQKVIKTAQKWLSDEQMMYVVGATKAAFLKDIRTIAPDHFLLVPGVGAQGGSLEEVAQYGMNKTCGLLVNSSRGIIFASEGEDFAEKAGKEASSMAHDMQLLLEKYL